MKSLLSRRRKRRRRQVVVAGQCPPPLTWLHLVVNKELLLGKEEKEEEANTLDGKFLIMALKIIIPNCQLYYHREWKIASHYLIVTYPICRWAVLAFGWLCSVQKRLLDMGAVMLSNAEAWEQVMDSTVEAIITTTTTTKVASSEGNNFPSKTGDGTPLFRYRSPRLQEREEWKLTSLTTSSPTKNKVSFDFDLDAGNNTTIDGSSGGGSSSSSAVPGNLALITNY